MSAPEADPTAGAGPLARRRDAGSRGGGAIPADDPLARIGRQLVGAAVARRRRRRHHAQRATGALLSVAALVAVGVVARPFDGGVRRPAAAERVTLDAGGRSFAVYATDGGALCSNRPDGRFAAGTTICMSPSLAVQQLRTAGIVWAQAHVEGKTFVITGIASAGAQRIKVFSAPPARRSGSFSGRSTIRPIETTAVTLPPLRGADHPGTVVRPFVVEVPIASMPSERLLVQALPEGGLAAGGHAPAPQTVEVDAPFPDSSLASATTAEFDIRGGASAAETVERAQERLQALGLQPSQVTGGGALLVVDVLGQQRDADVRSALAPGVVAFYDWEMSVLVPPDGDPVARGLSQQSGDAMLISQSGGAAGGLELADARALLRTASAGSRIVQAIDRDPSRPLARTDPRARFFVLRGEPALTGGELVDPRAGTNAAGHPDVEFGFDARGREAFQQVTRAVAQRGQGLQLPGVFSAELAQHFAVVLDGRLIAVPAIDPVQLPDGIDGKHGAVVEGGFTRASAARLATLLRLGPLPRLTPRGQPVAQLTRRPQRRPLGP